MSVVKPSGATTHLTFSQDGTLFVNTRNKVFTQSGATWSELKNDTNSMQCLQYSGASGTYTDAASACSDFFGNDTYIFPHEGNTLFSPASVLTDDAGSLSIRSFGLPTPTKYLYTSGSYEDVIDYITTPPISPSTNDKYLIDSVATCAWVGKENQIAEWNGSSWDYTVQTPTNKKTIDSDKGYIYI